MEQTVLPAPARARLHSEVYSVTPRIRYPQGEMSESINRLQKLINRLQIAADFGGALECAL